MKRFLELIFWIMLFFLVVNYRNQIVYFIMRNFVDKNNIVFSEANSYYKPFDYSFVQNTDNLFPKSKQDILNIIYTTLNKGNDNIIFYCDLKYNDCINDVNDIADNSEYLSVINNLVHPFNSYRNIYFTISTYGKVTVTINKIYSEEAITFVENKINAITNELFYPNISNYDKIKVFHDYIVYNTTYDESVSLENQLYIKTNANNAFGLFYDKKAVCSGYSDALAIFLNSQGFNNYKISSDEHIWNLVYIDGKWLHIDATWDDPITSNGSSIIIHDFFLIDTNTILKKENDINKKEHKFNINLYLEAS